MSDTGVPRPDDLPDNVSDIYWKLKDYIALNFAKADGGTKFLLFAVAYKTYCETKKKYIQGRKAQIPAPSLDDLRTAHLTFESDETYKIFAGAAEEIVRGFKSDEINRVVTTVLEKNKTTTWEHVKAHLITLAIVGLFITLLPLFEELVERLAHGASVGPILHNFGIWLSTTF